MTDIPAVIVAEQGDATSVSDVSIAESADDASIQIAQINADRDVAIAVASAEAQTEQTETIAEADITKSELEADQHEEYEECRKEIAELKNQMMTLAMDVSSILTKLTPPEPLPPNQSPAPENVEAMPVNPEEAAPPAEPERIKQRLHRWI